LSHESGDHSSSHLTLAPFIGEWIARLAPRRGEHAAALDVAMGRGRHAVALAIAGFRVFGVDARFDAVRDATLRASAAGVRVRGWCADLTAHPLPSSRFDVIVVTRYLQRNLFHALRGAVRPGGVVLYETFTTAQRALGTGPTSPDHLLEPGELRLAFDGFEVLFYEEVTAPQAVARIAARALGRR
jgi:2-polyprenyl-3-methyl-5-hydroxy-6-metoxy-1,4-benzoquinol methylase